MSLAVGNLVQMSEADSRGEILGEIERIGRYQAKVNFRRLPWTPASAKIPEMREVPIEQLKRCRDPWSDAVNAKWADLDAVRLRVKCAELWLANGQGQLGNARTDLLPHQVCLVQEVVERKRRRLLIAEEVGMGKTIETGMVIHALMQRKELDRCLVVCPAGQIGQWQEELEEKLRVRFEVYRRDIDGQRAFSYPRIIASLDTLKLDSPNKRLHGKSHLEILLEAPEWDLVVFDEAHRLTARDYGSRTDKTLNYRLAEQLSKRTRDFILLTGTPHDGNDGKFRNLLKALEPGVTFSKNAPGIFFGDMILKNRKSQARDSTGELLFKQVNVEKISLSALQSGESQFHKALNDYLREGYGFAEKDPSDPRHRALGFVMVTFQKLASSSASAVRAALGKRLNRLIKVTATKAEEQEAAAELDGRFLGEAEEVTSEELQAQHLRDEFTACEVKMLQVLLDCPVPEEAKWRELCRLIQAATTSNRVEKFLIFTEYKGTLRFLEKFLLEGFGTGSVVTIKGGMGADARRDTMKCFRENPSCRFLISTEAGGEGINLQFCNIVVNYDLPWNPFRVVQRIGRVHRIGQQKDMQVFNYRLLNELDERLSDCHEGRVDTAILRLSEVTGLVPSDIRDQLLGFAQEFINYDKVFSDSLARSEIRSSEKEITEGIARAEEAFRLAYETIFKHAVAPFNPDRFKKLVGASLTLEDLHKWLDAWLKQNGRRLMHRKEENLYEFLIPEIIAHGLSTPARSVQGTFDRSRNISDPTIPLLAFGHPVVDLLLRCAMSPEAGAFAGSVNQPKDDPEFSRLVVVLLQTEEHAGASAHHLLVVRQNLEGNWALVGSESVGGFVQNEMPAMPFDAASSRTSLEKFIQQEFPDTEFAAEKLHYVGLFST